jgi:hypothetical protein
LDIPAGNWFPLSNTLTPLYTYTKWPPVSVTAVVRATNMLLHGSKEQMCLIGSDVKKQQGDNINTEQNLMITLNPYLIRPLTLVVSFFSLSHL